MDSKRWAISPPFLFGSRKTVPRSGTTDNSPALQAGITVTHGVKSAKRTNENQAPRPYVPETRDPERAAFAVHSVVGLFCEAQRAGDGDKQKEVATAE